MKRYLIINADDYGLCYASNEAVERLFNEGFISSTTLMTTCPWAEDAAMRALANPRMKVGLHLTTTCEYENYKWGPLSRNSESLVDGKGYFWETAAESLRHANAEDMEREILAQFDWMASRGLSPEHIDSHMGTVYGIAGPPHLEPVFRLCAEHALNFRLPRRPETFFPGLDAATIARVAEVVSIADSMGIGLPVGLFTHDFDPSPEDDYGSFKKYYLSLIERCPEGVSELFLHPCIETPDLKAINRNWQKRVWEYRLMLDDEVLAFIQREGIELGSYSEAPFKC